ncbi:MAG: class I SAM-dependent methyltransferase [Betaproteobacteria bacterium]|nr:class I SAM-dependent methyltransferase [Betaproteobacteria bacterium]
MSSVRAAWQERSLPEYDQLQYDCLPFAQTHPARLATLALLFGLKPPAVETCRVLELGCGNGNNLIPMAGALPGARFVGIDLSARQVENGQALIKAAGLTNIELRHADIASSDAQDGAFDYIVAHGVYSWVPPKVRDRVLEICRANLAPNGVAYVSYNTLPGWSSNGMIRDMMLFQARDIEDPAARMRAGRGLLDFLAGAIPDTPYGALAREEIAFIQQQPDEYVAHDHMGECNDPVYFHQFAEHAARHRLKYLAEAEFSVMGLGGLPPQTIAAMRKLAPDIVAFEQLTDVLRHRSFRQTLLVHENVPIDRRLGAHSIAPLAIASPVAVAPRSPSSLPEAPVVFVARNGKRFGIGNALTRAALLHLIDRWPESVRFAELYETARRALPPVPGLAGMRGDSGPEALGVELLQLYAAGIAELRAWDPEPSATISEQPMTSRLARLQAQRGSELTTLLHQPLRLDPFERALVPLLDGKRNLATLAEALAANGVGAARHGDHRSPVRSDASAALRNALLRLAKAGALLKNRLPETVARITTAASAAFAPLVALEFDHA